MSASDLSIVYAEPRVLLVTIMNHFTQTLCVVVHGPLNTSTDRKPENYWSRVIGLVRKHKFDLQVILMTDGNASLSQSSPPYIGSVVGGKQKSQKCLFED